MKPSVQGHLSKDCLPERQELHADSLSDLRDDFWRWVVSADVLVNWSATREIPSDQFPSKLGTHLSTCCRDERLSRPFTEQD
ncbi:hypothetical protein TNCV_3476751 [Trichonephila clavipes]|nr:hypothetical protein TNCV_3476751 [Trichonephila clavipes]